MKKAIIGCLLTLFTGSVFAQQPLHVMTFNIRMNTPDDSLNAWPYRKDKVAATVKFYDVTTLGVQEALYDQMQDLRQLLPGFKSIGVGRDDGKNGGEFSAIFYDTTRLQALEQQTFWLSETPDVAGKKGWDAACNRVVTWAKFKDKKSGKLFYHFNTHFDHMGKIARRESAKLLLAQVNKIAGTTPAIITGDFNATPDDEPIRIITDVSDRLHLTDSKERSKTPHFGPVGTFNGWHTGEVEAAPIDYIFLKNKIAVLKHATISETWGGRYASDHFSVLAELQLQ
ncbi:endonuclease/exonuclease/phosphatase family protein [Chitinophaga sp. Cy-1792]|uniref:endonuclease/exonuclease/phosphatase family protein n=1 Tax=Chitinophaga sp. Cy-1792 TaxID=2608339 RepID=UPI0014230FEC|nr:endonuclease/exonuclease/phosphatase family protein [Chitinophaga sp. Cy-1792]NIG51940.1 endonuclease/exonuclease/phosphatase family protein [Chitinophaga sp. Cy-1792]